MEISTCGNGLWQHHATGVHSLPDSKFVTPPGDFLDEDRSEVFPTELFVNTEEIDFHGFDGVVADAEGDWNAGDESAEFTAFGVGCAEADVP